MNSHPSSLHTTYVDTPRGIFTEMGNWYSISEADLKSYAGQVLVHETILNLLRRADIWLRSAKNIIIWLAPLLLFQFNILMMLCILFLVYTTFSVLGPFIVSHTAYPLFKMLDNVFIQATFYILSLSYLAVIGNHLALFTGLLLFILVRWGIWNKLFDWFVIWCRKKIYRVPYEDQILKSVIIRAALKHRVQISDLEEMESKILDKLAG